MPELNADTPPLYCRLRSEYLYNGLKGHGIFIPCVVFGVASIPGHALGFHCLLNNGALIYRLPISAFVHKDSAPNVELSVLQLWDCFSSQIAILEYDFLGGMRVDVTLKDRTIVRGNYLYTIDWHGNWVSESPGEGGHKCAHIIELENGCYAAQPNNRIRWYEPAFITAPFPDKPDYETNEQVWSVENKGNKWKTEDSPRMFYDIDASTE